ncbi:SDR family NAD(P)-dependent oxidoreductase [Paenibacillus physcomitrellae]|uniref:Short-chain dehydrogenase n=1 Tax=Paenibacillus physcomitrellae TaxID=1619311 RepID=A0ABQ1FXT2_9BACL|nr:SDR family NAD(P)-dependent oxidoreductase [Paenibacillus physcomitrellae]GGA32246.1 short-chain dehydrogenase [Paenibacillus physcomitrellae]
MNRYAFVTGADRGLGLALVKGLLARGYTVFAGQYMPQWTELAELKQEQGDSLLLVPLDIGSGYSVGEAAKQVAAVTDRLEMLINAAAILGDTDATVEDELDFEEMQRVYNVNTLGSLRVTSALISHVLNSEGKLVVNISSEAGSAEDSERTSWFAYCMSKSAVNMQSKLIFNRIAPKGGKVLVVHPGWVRTYMSGTLSTEGELSSDESAAAILQLADERLQPGYRQKELSLIDYSGRQMNW